MTPQDSLTLQVADALSACGIPYLLAGSFASNYYGIPRSTEDADFVLQLAGGAGADFAGKLGTGFEFDPQLSFETVTGTYRQYLRHVKTAFKIELFMLTKDAHDQERFARRREQNLYGRKVWLLSPEDVMSVQRDKLDWGYIGKWCREHGTLALMEEIRRSVPEI